LAKKIKFSSNSVVDTTKTTKNKQDKTYGFHDEKINKIDELIQSKEKEKQGKQEKERQKREELKQKEEERIHLEKEKQKQKEERLKELKKQKLEKQRQKEAKIKAKQEEKQRILEQMELKKKQKQDKKLRLIKAKELEMQKQRDAKKEDEKKKLEKQNALKEKESLRIKEENQRLEEERLKEIEHKKLEKQKQFEERLKAKHEFRLAKEKKLEKKRQEKQKKREKRSKEIERQRLDMQKQKQAKIKAEELRLAKEKELQQIKQEKEKLEKKSIFKSKKFDQSEIEVVKKHDEGVINIPNEIDETVDFVKEGNIIYERKGYGWKGQGSRKIVFDDKTKQHMYLISEPELSDEEEKIKDKLVHLFRVRADVDVFEMDIDVKKQHLNNALEELMAKNKIEITESAKDKIFYYIFREFIGYGKIDIMMKDEVVEDISCDGHNIPIFIYHKDYENIKSNVVFGNVDELTSFVIKLSQMCGKQISVYEPVVDGKLSDGSRLQTTLGKTITKYSTFTIRRFREDPLTPIDLIKNNTMSVEMAAYFWMAIESGASVLFCGGTASGKTTALNALSLFLPFSYKIVSVEDTREINLPHENWIAGTTRTGFSSSEQSKTGKDIDMFDLIRVALRQYLFSTHL